MKHLALLIFLLFCAFLFTGHCQKSQAFEPSAERLKHDVYVLASDSLEGRKPPLQGQKKAAAYIAEQFKNAGLKQVCKDTWYQKIPLNSYSYGKSFLYYDNKMLSSGSHFAFASTKPAKFSGEFPVKFIGYNLLPKNPASSFQDSIIYLLDKSIETAMERINFIAKNYHVRYFAISLPDNEKQVRQTLEAEKHQDEYIYPSTAFEFMNRSYKCLYQYFTDTNPDIQILLIDDYLFEELYVDQLDEADTHAWKQFRKGKMPEMNPLNIKLEANFHFSTKPVFTENVVGIIEGSDTSGECIVIGAHYDHEGKKGNKIYYGADDNASGTAALMELARWFGQNAKEGIVPKRSIVFIAFTAEELGLNGSAYYVANPLFPLNKTAYMINMDMIGRTDKSHADKPNFVYVKAMGKYKRKIKNLNKQADKRLPDIYVDKTPGFWLGFLYRMGSDHFSFVRRDVPSAVYFTGLHDDYHTPRDTPDKINFSNMVNVVKIVFEAANHIANNTESFSLTK